MAPPDPLTCAQLGHINSLKNFLLSTRQAYMQIGPSRWHLPKSAEVLNGPNITTLTDKERDEIDFEAKSIIRQTMDRIKTMEDLEAGNWTAHPNIC